MIIKSAEHPKATLETKPDVQDITAKIESVLDELIDSLYRRNLSQPVIAKVKEQFTALEILELFPKELKAEELAMILQSSASRQLSLPPPPEYLETVAAFLSSLCRNISTQEKEKVAAKLWPSKSGQDKLKRRIFLKYGVLVIDGNQMFNFKEVKRIRSYLANIPKGHLSASVRVISKWDQAKLNQRQWQKADCWFKENETREEYQRKASEHRRMQDFETELHRKKETLPAQDYNSLWTRTRVSTYEEDIKTIRLLEDHILYDPETIYHETGHGVWYYILKPEERNKFNQDYGWEKLTGETTDAQNFIEDYGMLNEREDFATLYEAVYKSNNTIETCNNRPLSLLTSKFIFLFERVFFQNSTNSAFLLPLFTRRNIRLI